MVRLLPRDRAHVCHRGRSAALRWPGALLSSATAQSSSATAQSSSATVQSAALPTAALTKRRSERACLQVLDSYEEALAACEDLSWIPARFHEIAEAEFKREFRREESSQGSTALGNGTVDDDGGYTQCWVERTDHTHVYLDVAEPLKVYGDLLAVLVLVAVALIFAVCIAREHRSSVIEWIHRVRNPFDAGVGPAEPGVVGDDKTRTQLNSYQQRRAGRASKEFNQWSSELHTMTREMV